MKSKSESTVTLSIVNDSANNNVVVASPKLKGRKKLRRKVERQLALHIVTGLTVTNGVGKRKDIADALLANLVNDEGIEKIETFVGARLIGFTVQSAGGINAIYSFTDYDHQRIKALSEEMVAGQNAGPFSQDHSFFGLVDGALKTMTLNERLRAILSSPADVNDMRQEWERIVTAEREFYRRRREGRIAGAAAAGTESIEATLAQILHS